VGAAEGERNHEASARTVLSDRRKEETILKRTGGATGGRGVERAFDLGRSR